MLLQEAYDEAIKVSPIKALEQKAVYYANRAQVYLNLKQYQEAVKEASASLNLRPTDAIKIKALARRAQAYEGLKDIVRAYYDYEKVYFALTSYVSSVSRKTHFHLAYGIFQC